MKFLNFDSTKSNSLLTQYSTLSGLKTALTPSSVAKSFIDNCKTTVNDQMTMINGYVNQAKMGVNSLFSTICDNVDSMTNLDTSVLNIDTEDYDDIDVCVDEGLAQEISLEQFEQISEALFNLDDSNRGNGYTMVLGYQEDESLVFHIDGEQHQGTTQSTIGVYGVTVSYNGHYFPILQSRRVDDVDHYFIYKYIPQVYDIESIETRNNISVYSWGLIAKLLGESTTILDIFDEVTSDIGKNGNLNVSLLYDHVNAKVGELSYNCSRILNELTEAYNSYGVAGVVQYLKQMLSNQASVDISQQNRLIFTDNQSIKVKPAFANVFSGIITTITQVAAAAFTAVSPLISIAAGAVGGVITNVTKAVDLKIANVTLGVINRNADQNWYPLGLAQVSASKSASEVYPDILEQLDNFGCLKNIGPGFELLISQTENNFGIEAHLTPWVGSAQNLKTLLITNGWLTYSAINDTVSFNLPNDQLTGWSNLLQAYNGDRDDIESTLTSVATDTSLRHRYFNAMCYFTTALLLSGLRYGTGSLTFNLNSLDENENRLARLLLFIYNNVGEDVEWYWDDITGNSVTDIAAMWILKPIYECNWSTVITGHSVTLYTLMAYHLPYCLNAFMLGIDKSTAAQLLLPINRIDTLYVTIPQYDRSDLVKSIIMSGLIIAAATAITVTIGLSCKRKIDALQSSRQRNIEAAWNAYVNPTTGGSLEQYNTYRKAVKKNNFIARLTGGTIYSKVNYWADDSSDNGVKDSTLLDRVIGIVHNDTLNNKSSVIELDDTTDEPNMLKLSKSIKSVSDDVSDIETLLTTINSAVDRIERLIR